MSKQSPTYLTAIKSTEELDPPAVGFARRKDYPTVQDQVQAILKQNNTLIELLAKLDQKVTELQQSIRTLQREKQVAQPNVTEAVNELSAKLAGITITGDKGKEPIKATTTPYYVFKNPKAIFNEEKIKK